MRIGEVTEGPHTLRAKDVHLAYNKNKIKVVLYTSKTHGTNKKLQEIKITAWQGYDNTLKRRCFCPFDLMQQYFDVRGGYWNIEEKFFVFRDGSMVKPSHVRNLLFMLLQRVRLNPCLYNTHSFRSGRSLDLLQQGKNLQEIKEAGRWFSMQYIDT